MLLIVRLYAETLQPLYCRILYFNFAVSLHWKLRSEAQSPQSVSL